MLDNRCRLPHGADPATGAARSAAFETGQVFLEYRKRARAVGEPPLETNITALSHDRTYPLLDDDAAFRRAAAAQARRAAVRA